MPAAETRPALQLILQIGKLSLITPRAAVQASDRVCACARGSLL